MTRYLILSLIAACCQIQAIAQQSFISGKIKDYPNQVVLLKSYYGYQSPLVDSVRTDNQGRFSLSYTPEYREGMMRIAWGNAESEFFLDIAVEDSVAFDWTDEQLVRFSKGKKSRAFNQLIRETESLRSKLATLDEVLAVFSSDKKYRKQTLKMWQNTRGELSAAYGRFFRSVGKTDFAEFAKALQRLEPPHPQHEQNIENYWQGAEFDHPILLHWNFIPQKIRDYFNFFVDIPQSPQEAEEVAKRFTDLSFQPIMNNLPLRENMVAFLVEGFEGMGLSNLVLYLEENYLPEEGCTDGRADLQERLDRIRRFQPGKSIPEFDMRFLPEGKLPAKTNIFIFFSPHCPHCRESLPQWLHHTQRMKNAHVIAVSTEDESATRQLLPEIPENWTLVVDNDLANTFMIYATPDIIVVSEDGIILQRPQSVEEIGEY
jgi:hypothetical protein